MPGTHATEANTIIYQASRSVVNFAVGKRNVKIIIGLKRTGWGMGWE